VREQELFDWLKVEYFPDLEHSPNEYDGFDCITAENKMFIELKSRHTHYPTLLIEKKKYDFLLEKSSVLSYNPYYINSTPEGVWSFDLNDMPELEWAEKRLPITTEFTNTSYTMKVVGFLPVEKGNKLK
jgi:hypothetical protein